MKNREKYAEEIIEATVFGTCPETRNIAGIACGGNTCGACREKYAAWLEAEYVEPQIDWREVEIDTPIFVSCDGEKWEKAHFASYIDGCLNAWYDGRTSFTAKNVCFWPYAKLAEGSETER